MQRIDLLVVGSGGAGLAAALEAASRGAKVAVVTKSLPTQAQTCMAQGGINAALGNVEPDSPEEHVADTLRSAHGLADEAMVRTLCESAPETIAWLDRMLVPFSRVDSLETPHSLQTIAQRRLGGASHPRACYAQDFTGLKILQSLYDRCLEAGVRFHSGLYLLDLITTEDREVLGAEFWDIRAGELRPILARATLLATGGFGGLYHGYSTNAYGASGDGIAAALRAGGVLEDMEFVQFHPTAIRPAAVLISEAARGAGAWLVNEVGERFTDELGPRDVVARAMFEQIAKGHELFLDLRPISEGTLRELLPQELHLARLHAEVDPLQEPIPVMPAVHYTMGGIAVDSTLRIRGLRRAYAAGECSAARIHGANRLGGNSLLEIVVFGRMAAANALDESGSPSQPPSLGNARERIEAIFARPQRFNHYLKRKILGKRLYHDLGIVRDGALIGDALDFIGELESRLGETGLRDRSRAENRDLVELLEYENSLLLARALALAAHKRQESRGAHYRSDHPEESKAWERHIQVKMEDGEVVTC